VTTERRTGWWPYIIMGLIVVVCLGLAAGRSAGPETAEDRINAVAKTIKCPTCQGESVADSNAPSSREIRDDIADRLSRGEDPDQIRAFYAQSYGDAILLTPSATGLASVVWIVPVLVLVGAAAGLVVAFRRWRAPGALHATEHDRQVVQEALADRSPRGPEPHGRDEP
jgi:cytochrome c-type biogenesis protein CcmH